ncbi:MAG TPA: glycosyltransferase family 4 protein [Albitalea sp.]|nr:glycosyltransferase family 4 protein [Albitalea sp.]
MRVLIVSDVTGYMRGGVPTETVHLVRGLMARGHAVALAGDVVPRGAEAVRHCEIGVPTGKALATELAQAIADFKPDIVHVLAMSSRGIGQIAPVLATQPWTLTCHSLPPYERKLPALHGSDRLHYAARSLRFLANALAWKWLMRRRLMPQVIVHSEGMQTLVTRYGFPASQVALVPLGCEPPPPRRDAGMRAVRAEPRIVTMGGIAHTKGQHDAVLAMAELRRHFPGLQYQIIGEVRDLSYLRFVERSIEALGLDDKVSITPNLPHDEKEQALQEADLYLQPSHEEGFCLAYIEAAGIVPRLVGADTGAIRLIGADDEGARTVPAMQPARLAAAMRELLQATLPDDLMARRAARLATRFSWAQYLDAHEALYWQAMGGWGESRAAASAA